MRQEPPPYSSNDKAEYSKRIVDGKSHQAYDPSQVNQAPQLGMGEYSYLNQGQNSEGGQNYGAPSETHWESGGGLAQHSAGSYKPVPQGQHMPGFPPPPPPSQPQQLGMVPQGTYQYRGPRGDIITTHLPPDHPSMQCLQKGHKSKTEFGMVGVVCGIVFFPVGCIATAIDRRTVCKRCGLVMDQGIFSK